MTNHEPWTHLFRPGREEPGIGGTGAHVAHFLPHGPSAEIAAVITHSHALHGARHLSGTGAQATGRRAVGPRPRLPRWAGAPAGSRLAHLQNGDDKGIFFVYIWFLSTDKYIRDMVFWGTDANIKEEGGEMELK